MYDKRGRPYVLLDEALDMLIVRILKSLNVTMLSYRETASAWILSVSNSHRMIRMVTASYRAYQNKLGSGDGDEKVNPLHFSDKAAI